MILTTYKSWDDAPSILLIWEYAVSDAVSGLVGTATTTFTPSPDRPQDPGTVLPQRHVRSPATWGYQKTVGKSCWDIEKEGREGRKKVYFCRHVFSKSKILGGFEYIFLCSPRKLGKMNPFWLILFQMGWFNHQLVYDIMFLFFGV